MNDKALAADQVYEDIDQEALIIVTPLGAEPKVDLDGHCLHQWKNIIVVLCFRIDKVCHLALVANANLLSYIM